MKTNQRETATEYFYHREVLLHGLVPGRWLKQNLMTDQQLRPMLQIPSLFDSTEGFPKDATALLTIAPDGTVTEVSIDRDFPAESMEILTNTLRAWLFSSKDKA